MRVSPPLVLLCMTTFVFSACKSDTDTSDLPIPSFSDAAVPAEISGDLDPATVDAHNAFQAMGAIAALAASDPLVLDLMQRTTSTARMAPCWTPRPVGSIGVTLDFLLCGSGDLTGELTVTDTALGPLVISANTVFEYAGRGLVNGIGLEPVPGDVFSWTWSPKMSNGTDAPSTGIVIDGDTLDISYSGDLDFSSMSRQSQATGTADVTGPNGTASMIIGARTLEDLDSPTGRFPVANSLYPTCRCTTGGVLAYPTTVHIDEVQLDLNRAYDNGGTTWPTISIPTSLDIAGTLIVQPGRSCGVWQGEFKPADNADTTLPGSDIAAGIQSACENNAFGDADTCARAKSSAEGLAGIKLTINDRLASSWGKEMADRQFDNGFCE